MLAGQYVQISVILYSFCIVLNILFWVFMLENVLRWFGFNDDTVNLGYQYGMVVLFHEWIVGMSYAYHGILQVIEKEKWSTILGLTEDVTNLLLLIAVLLTREVTLQDVALLELSVEIAFFLFNCCYTVYKGWMNPYLEGMVGSFALKVRDLC